jgi:hypothetical protein
MNGCHYFNFTHCIKRVLDTETNGCHYFNFTEKRFYEVWTLGNQIISNVYFDLSLKLSQGEVHDISGEVQKFPRERGAGSKEHG